MPKKGELASHTDKDDENPKTSFDITIYEGHNDFGLDHNKVIVKLREWCKKWVFQEEKCPTTETLHFQCRVRLITRKRLKQVISVMGKELGGNYSITTLEIHDKQDFNYVLKADSRTRGPWSDKEFVEPPPMTRQLQVFIDHVNSTGFRPYQEFLKEVCEGWDMRYIHLVYDKIGNVGKSLFVEWLEYMGLGFEVPPFRQMEDIMQFAHSFPNQKTYLIDMPRAMKKDKLGEFYAGLECLKNGKLYDKRNFGKARRMSRPNVIVFTNVLPAWDCMSLDRWQVWCMTKDFRLEALEIPNAESDDSALDIDGTI